MRIWQTIINQERFTHLRGGAHHASVTNGAHFVLRIAHHAEPRRDESVQVAKYPLVFCRRLT